MKLVLWNKQARCFFDIHHLTSFFSGLQDMYYTQFWAERTSKMLPEPDARSTLLNFHRL